MLHVLILLRHLNTLYDQYYRNMRLAFTWLIKLIVVDHLTYVNFNCLKMKRRLLYLKTQLHCVHYLII